MPSDARVGLLWRGDRSASQMSPKAAARLGPLLAALEELGVAVEPVVYADEAVDAVREQLSSLDGVLVWVNPIQDGADRSQLDELLREASSRGVWVSAHPDVIAKLGTKEVLYRTRTVGWGADVDMYESIEAFAARFPTRLAMDGTRVVKQGRGNGGNGVWRVQLSWPLKGADASPDAVVLIQHAVDRGSAPEQTTLGAFVERCRDYFGWSGCLVDQPFMSRLADGLVRCYFVHDTVVGFCHQWPKGLLDQPADPQPEPQAPSVMEPPDTSAYASLRVKVDAEWIPAMKQLLVLATEDLPVIWDADFLFGPRTETGEDTFVLCEINVSAVWPFPPGAAPTLARAATDRILEHRHSRHPS
ncbi:MAG: Cj0069 family protein [Actinomycetota bacterium]